MPTLCSANKERAALASWTSVLAELRWNSIRPRIFPKACSPFCMCPFFRPCASTSSQSGQSIRAKAATASAVPSFPKNFPASAVLVIPEIRLCSLLRFLLFDLQEAAKENPHVRTKRKPSVLAGRARDSARLDHGPKALGVGSRAARKIAQLLDRYLAPRWPAAPHACLGHLVARLFLVQHRPSHPQGQKHRRASPLCDRHGEGRRSCNPRGFCARNKRPQAMEAGCGPLRSQVRRPCPPAARVLRRFRVSSQTSNRLRPRRTPPAFCPSRHPPEKQRILSRSPPGIPSPSHSRRALRAY